MAEELSTRVARFVGRHGLIRPGHAVDVALSGGIDSVALLSILAELAESCGWVVRGHHVRHRMREDDDKDVAVCAAVCRRLQVPLVVTELDVGQVRHAPGRGPEERARALRYAALEARAARDGVARIATGHHGDDNLETLLIRLLRGAGLEGLAGMAPSRCLVGAVEPRIHLVRPLLEVCRADTAEYVRVHGLETCEDPTNDDRTYLRNRVRLDAVPALARASGSRGLAAARRTVLNLRHDADALGLFAEHLVANGARTDEPAWYLPLAQLEELGRAAAAQVLRHAAHGVVPGHVPSAGAIARGLDQLGLTGPHRQTHPKGGAWDDGAVQIGLDGLFASVRSRHAVPPIVPPPRTLELEEAIDFGEAQVVVSHVAPSAPVWTHVSAVRLEGPLRVVPASTVPRVELVNEQGLRVGSKATKKILAELGVPRPWRDGHPVIVDDLGPVWVVGDRTVRGGHGASGREARVFISLPVATWYLCHVAQTGRGV